MEFGAAVDGFGLETARVLGVSVGEFVDGSVRGVLEPPCAAEIDDLDAAFDGFGDPLARLLVRCSEEQDFGSGVYESLPGEGKDLVGVLVTCDRELRVDVFEVE